MKNKILKVIVRVLIFLAVLEIMPRLGSGIFLLVQNRQNKLTISKNQNEYLILCLGESTTALGGENSYPRQLEGVLNSRQNKIHFSVINKGIPAVTTSQIAANLDHYLSESHPDLVISMIGINDGHSSALITPASVNPWEKILNNSKAYKLIRYLWERQQKAKVPDSLDNDPGVKKLLEYVKTQPSPQVYAKLGNLYMAGNETSKALEALSTALKMDPNHTTALGYLGILYTRQGDFKSAIPIFTKMISLITNPQSTSKIVAYEHLADCYRLLGDEAQAEQIYREEAVYLPTNPTVYGELGNMYLQRGQYEEAEKLYVKQLRFNPNNETVYAKLAHCFRIKGQSKKAEILLRQGFNLNPKSVAIATELGAALVQDHQYSEAQTVLKTALNLSQARDHGIDVDIYSYLLESYKAQGKTSETQEIKKLLSKHHGEFNPMTADNYQKIYTTLQRQKIKFFAMQYPMRPVDLLKQLLPQSTDVIFVDNEKKFKELVAQESYDYYFIDRFAGDFGHCTPKGNQLIAEHLADIIFKNL